MIHRYGIVCLIQLTVEMHRAWSPLTKQSINSIHVETNTLDTHAL